MGKNEDNGDRKPKGFRKKIQKNDRKKKIYPVTGR